MKKISLILFFVVGIYTSWAQEDAPYKVVSYQGVKSIQVSTTGGNISATGTAGSSVKVEVFVKKGYKSRSLSHTEIEQALKQDYELILEQKGSSLHLEAKRRGWFRESYLNISFRLMVPVDVTTDLSTSGGNIDLMNLNGQQKVTTSGGNITANKVHGGIEGSTSGGNIVLKDVTERVKLSTSGGNINAEQGNGSITLSTSGGNVDARDMKGPVELSTSGGNVSASRMQGALKAFTSGGNVAVTEMNGTLDAGTSGGSVTASVASLGSHIKLTNSAGSISLSIPKGKGVNLDINGSRVETENLVDFTGSASKGQLRGTLFGGGVPIRVSTDGKVNLSFLK